MKKVCVVTGTRAEYGLLRWVIDGIQKSPALQLQLVATGMHLSPEFGMTIEAIEADGYHVDRRVEMLLSSDTTVGVTKSMGLGLIGFADALSDLKPDLMLILGDRFEVFAAATAALIARVPIAHLHGGELTEGAFDEALRHSITKMSHIHFVAAEEYRRRVIQLGENPAQVFLVGGLGVDALLRLNFLGREALESELGIRFRPRNLLITYHPVTLEAQTGEIQMAELLAVLSAVQDTTLIFTMPNADTDGRILYRRIAEFVTHHPNAYAFKSLGQLRYMSCMAQVDAVVGNSSSGILEAPSLKIGTINIGDRQRGRLRAASVLDAEPNSPSIRQALAQLYDPAFQTTLASAKNPHGDGGASNAIVSALEQVELPSRLKKRFYDVF